MSLILIQRLVSFSGQTYLSSLFVFMSVCMYVYQSYSLYHCGLDSIFSVKRSGQIRSGQKKNLKYYFNLRVCLSIHMESITLYGIRFLLFYQKMPLIKIATIYRGFCHLEIIDHRSPVTIEERLYLFLPMKLERNDR